MLEVSHVQVRSILTRTSGYLSTICSHSLQPYRGCSLGNSLCGQACYVRHNRWITSGREWGSFLEVRDNAASSYLRQYNKERDWARREQGALGIFLSSSTEPFLPQEGRFRITRSVLEAMLASPPDALILQTRSPQVVDHVPLLVELAKRTQLRVHITVETDRVGLLGLPRAASSPQARLGAARILKAAGVRVVITVSPLLPIAEPEEFFGTVAECCDAVVLDHFIGGDGSSLGSRTLRTAVPAAMAALDVDSIHLAYRDRMAAVAARIMPGRVGLSIDGFAGRFSL